MKAIELNGFQGIRSLHIVDVEPPKPSANEVLMRVKAAGINFAEIEMTKGKYPAPKKPPFVMGFEAAGIVVEAGTNAKNVNVGDKITAVESSGGYAEYATADASMAIAIPDGISFAEATTIPIHGLTAYTMLKLAAKPQPDESVLIQAAAGGVGIFLVQLAKILGVKRVIALASSDEKTRLVKSLGADVAINYSQENWLEEVSKATGGNGVDVVLEAAAGEVGETSFKLLAPFGRMVVFGARNIHDTFSSERIRQLVYKNQTIIGFNIRTLGPDRIAECMPGLLSLITSGKLKLFASASFPLAEVKAAFESLSGRQTVGKVVLIP
jgi:NADPH2:quinone reductase